MRMRELLALLLLASLAFGGSFNCKGSTGDGGRDRDDDDDNKVEVRHTSFIAASA
jgi:hypothetical protein